MKKRLSGSATSQPFHWYYLEGFVAALDEPFEIREAKARLHFYRHVPITILPGECIVGQVDWNEPLVCQVSNTHLRADVIERIQHSEPARCAEKRKIVGMGRGCAPVLFRPLAPPDRRGAPGTGKPPGALYLLQRPHRARPTGMCSSAGWAG